MASSFSLLLVLCFVSLIGGCHGIDEERKAYIAYLKNRVGTDQSTSSHHLGVLREAVNSRFEQQHLLRSYTRSFNGFAANLTAQEQVKLANHEAVVSVFPSITYYPQTTRSWDFMGFAENAHRNLAVESDIIVGVIDTGIWPESESFNDKGFGPPPKKWKGVCNGGKNFTCNNKLIGARVYTSDKSARDTEGHGTHTASTAAGIPVKDVSFYGIGKGIARGGVPCARIAAYKVCEPRGCDSFNMLAAFDDAIADGVDIISISINSPFAQPVSQDVIAQGALHASQKGILVAQSTGNTAAKSSTSSVVPWVFSVAASSTDRGIITKVATGNGTILSGKAVNSFSLSGKSFPLVYGEGASRVCNPDDSRDCLAGCLDENLVKGKIVLCRVYNGITVASTVGAVGSVAAQSRSSDVSFVVPVAGSSLKEDDFNLVERYFNSTKDPKISILTSETIKNINAPKVASFSSRGANEIIPDILKPDISAPGIEILAAYSPVSGPSETPSDHRSVNYNIISGTSMACPHVAGAAAYVKSFHPNWSASSIQSSLMTTAWKMDPKKDPLAEFSYGAGHINPLRAVDPGLVYETSSDDFIKIYCSLGGENIFQGNVTCPKGVQFAPKDLNYPSITSSINNGTFSEIFTRTVTNVGPGKSEYKVKTSTSPDYKITVKPEILSFGTVNEKKTFEVTISGKTKKRHWFQPLWNGLMVSTVSAVQLFCIYLVPKLK
ncbi:hypothetical protein ACS0TY_009953 [Phlomoides rotata]